MRDGAARTGRGGAAPPRLLVITPDFPPAPGGIQVLTHRLVAALEGFERRTVTLDSEGARQFDSASGLRVRRVRADRRLGAARNLVLNAASLTEALAFRPDVTLVSHIVASPAAAVIRAALGAPAVVYVHANEIVNKPRLCAFAARRSEVVISVSSYTSGLLASVGASPRRLELIPPGVDLPSDASTLPAGRPTLLTIARLEHRYKGHDVLLEALASIRARVGDVEWVVIGEGALRPELEARARAQGLAGSVRFLGAVSDEERNSWLRRADVVAMPSRLPGAGLAGEGFGMVYLEAAAYGKPVVAGNVAGALDAVSDGETGLLVDPTDAGAVAGAVARLLLEPELARRLGAAGAERARRYAWPVIAKRVEAVLLELL
jgi:phosphatidylinositol alpha-1,6-mannosyltransferase